MLAETTEAIRDALTQVRFELDGGDLASARDSLDDAEDLLAPQGPAA